jgi:hypothetical protein
MLQALLGFIIVGSFPCVAILWTWTVIVALRLFSIRLPFSFPIHINPRRQRELDDVLKGKSLGTYVLVSGFLLFSCPLWAGLTAYNLLCDRYIWPSTYSVGRFTGTILTFAVAGVWFGVRDWKRSAKRESGITI